MSHVLEDLKAFLDSSPTSWHATSQMGTRLALQDYIPLSEGEKWNLEKGKKYFVIRDGSFCAFSAPTQKPTKSVILAAHTDSPALKLKPSPEVQIENMSQLGVEVYGSPLLSSWLNRDLAIAGRVVVSDKKGNVEEKLVFLDATPLIIPQLAVHLDRDVNEKGLVLNKQDNLRPIVGLGTADQTSLTSLLRREISFHQLLSFDLFLVPIEGARFIGSEGELLASYRIDNLASVHAALTAFGMVEEPSKHTLRVAIFWDHEEVGSRSREGAGSPFYSDVLKRICLSYKMEEEECLILKNNSLCLSLDMAHALNPNYPGKHDANHQPLLGKGVVIKYNADQKYASNAVSAAVLVRLCRSLNLPLQTFVSRSDMPCGSTIGPIHAQQTGILTVDLGCPQWSMHSCREVMACQDYMDMCLLLSHLLKEE